MKIITWQENYNTGIAEIDQQHMKLVAILNGLQNAISSQLEEMIITDVLNSLEKYTSYHFETEERLMAESEYPDQTAHEKKHSDFGDKVKYLKENNDNGRNVSAEEIVKMLSDWLLDHILNDDKKLAQSLLLKAQKIMNRS